MAPLYDNYLNLSDEVSNALGYHAERANSAPSRRNAQAEAQPRHARDQGDGNPAGFFGIALWFFLIICTVVGVGGAVPRTGSTVTAGFPPQTSAQSREGQSVGIAEPAQEQQTPPAIETANLVNDSQQTTQSAPQFESVPNSVGASDPSLEWTWVCLQGKLTCAVKDPNGNWVQSFSLVYGGEIRGSEINPQALRPPGTWSCQTGGPKTNMYCTSQDEHGQFLQGFLYDRVAIKEIN